MNTISDSNRFQQKRADSNKKNVIPTDYYYYYLPFLLLFYCLCAFYVFLCFGDWSVGTLEAVFGPNIFKHVFFKILGLEGKN